MIYIVAYDISKDKQRKRVSDKLQFYGIRVQYSVFECSLSATELSEVKQFIEKNISKKTDSAIFYPVCGKCVNGKIEIGTRYSMKISGLFEV